jgi:hypothetical protein
MDYLIGFAEAAVAVAVVVVVVVLELWRSDPKMTMQMLHLGRHLLGLYVQSETMTAVEAVVAVAAVAAAEAEAEEGEAVAVAEEAAAEERTQAMVRSAELATQ